MRFSIRHLLTVLALTAAWVGLWGSLSVANVLSGLIVAGAIVAAGFGTAGDGLVRPIPLARLMWRVLVDLTRSTIAVTKEVLTPTDHIEEGIIAVEMPPGWKRHQLLLTIAITITPGTAVVDADADNDILYLHTLYVGDRAETEALTKDLARLAEEALPPRNRTEATA